MTAKEAVQATLDFENQEALKEQEEKHALAVRRAALRKKLCAEVLPSLYEQVLLQISAAIHSGRGRCGVDVDYGFLKTWHKLPALENSIAYELLTEKLRNDDYTVTWQPSWLHIAWM